MRVRFDTPAESRETWGWVQAELGDDRPVAMLVPSCYERYVSIPNSRDPLDGGCNLIQSHDAACPDGRDQLARLLDVLAAPGVALHCALWDGYAGVFHEPAWVIPLEATRPDWPTRSRWERARIRRRARREAVRSAREARKQAPTPLPIQEGRNFITWTTVPARLREDAEEIGGWSPTMVFPEGRAWFWYSAMGSSRTVVGGDMDLLDVLIGPEWGGQDIDIE